VCIVLPFVHLLPSNGKNKAVANIVCYTRSSPLIHQLPSMYPRSTYSTKEEQEKSKECIETLIHDQVYKNSLSILHNHFNHIG